MTPLREGQQAQCGIIGCTINYLPYFLVHSIDFLVHFFVKVNNLLMPSLPIWRKGMGFYYIIKLLLLFTRFFWTLSHWIWLKWVRVQLWDMFGIIMLLPGFLYIFPWDFLGMGQCVGLWETFWNKPKFSSCKQVGCKVGLIQQPLTNQACFV